MNLRAAAPDAALLALSATEVWATRSFGGSVALGFACLGTAALLLRRRFPLTAFTLTLPALALGYIWFSPMGTLYEVSAGRPGRFPTQGPRMARAVPRRIPWPAFRRVPAREALIGGCALVTAVVGFVPWPFRDPVGWTLSDTILALMLSALLAVAPTALGLLASSRRELAGRLDELAASRERERSLAAEQAVVMERTRLAREMHDTVAHHLSLIAVQSGALEVTAEGPQVRAAAGAVRELSRDALDELRRMVGLLRLSVTSGEELAAGPGLAGIPALVAAAGPRTHGELDGVADGTDGGDAPPAEVQHAAYRIVQEALTNVRKHAPGARTRVLVRRSDGALLVEVRNDPGAQAAQPALPSGGHGLEGLRERAVQLGGDFDALPAASGGFLVRARLPVGPSAEAV
ncbi:sensor histidine kinase [Actinacidiphila paucisporea]|uniref:histidine kinase n=1 Tax=Actinacidiphila paucisporea TaxID=310782 RepID=A0A1M6WNZ1_9ACTN|nr:sensor histidine kinase [Actinacidiphila paucisporea]SHK95457.1 Histidine kinase [Actinacidiphila paucisporea]